MHSSTKGVVVPSLASGTTYNYSGGEAIQGIRDDFEKILVITHVESLKEAFPTRIEVTKLADVGSRFEVYQ